MAKRKAKHLRKFHFTKADANACKAYKGDKSKFGKCMAYAVRKRLGIDS